MHYSFIPFETQVLNIHDLNTNLNYLSLKVLSYIEHS